MFGILQIKTPGVKTTIFLSPCYQTSKMLIYDTKSSTSEINTKALKQTINTNYSVPFPAYL